MPNITFVTDPNDDYILPALTRILDIVHSSKYLILKERLDQSIIKYDIHTDQVIDQSLIEQVSYSPVEFRYNQRPTIDDIDRIKRITTRLLLTQVDWVEVIEEDNNFVVRPQYRNKPIYRPKSVVDDIAYLIDKPELPSPRYQEWSPYYLDGNFRNLNDNIQPYHIHYAFIKAWILTTGDIDQVEHIKVYPNLLVEVPHIDNNNIKSIIDMVDSIMVQNVMKWTVIPIRDQQDIYRYRSKYPSLIVVNDKLISEDTLNIDNLPEPIVELPKDPKEINGYYYLLSNKPLSTKKYPEVQIITSRR